MLYPLRKPHRNVRFGDSPKGAQFRQIMRTLDRNRNKYRTAIKDVIECYNLWTKAANMGVQITDDGWIGDRRFLGYLNNMFDFEDGRAEEAFEDDGTYEEL